jgi:hypothetical protein
VHDPDRVAVQQRVELLAQRREAPRLDLDQFAAGAHEVDHIAVDLDLEGVAGCREQPLEVAMERAFAENADHVAEIL